MDCRRVRGGGEFTRNQVVNSRNQITNGCGCWDEWSVTCLNLRTGGPEAIVWDVIFVIINKGSCKAQGTHFIDGFSWRSMLCFSPDTSLMATQLGIKPEDTIGTLCNTCRTIATAVS